MKHTEGWVGRPLRRFEDPALVTGRGTYTGDLPAALWVRIVRSPVASARIRAIRAPALPPGARLITAADLAGVGAIRPIINKFNYVKIGQPLLAEGVVRFVGEPVAAVLAASQAEAEDIAEEVELDLEDLPAVVDARQALAEGAPAVHAEAPGNVVIEGRIHTPGFDAAWASAHRRVALDVRSRRQNATPMEARGAHGAWDPVGKRVTLTCSTQTPHMTRTAIADLLGMREADLRVVAPDVGGGFGQKMQVTPEYALVAWLARTLKTSVAWSEDRRENLMASYHSRDQYVRIEGAFDAAGKLLAVKAEILANVGAYSCHPTTAGVEPLMAMGELPAIYAFAEYDCHARGLLTNTCPMAPYRGVSRPVVVFCFERLMETAARELGLDALELRRRNFVRQFPYRTAAGLVLDEGSYAESLEVAAREIGLEAFRARQAEARAQGRYLGIGFGAYSERSGFGTPAFAARGMEVTPGWENAEIAMDPSGAVEVRIGASPHGQGLATALSQMVADQLGVRPESVRVLHGDTDRTPYGWGTFASRSLVISGGAVHLAAGKLRAKLLAMAGQVLEAAEADLVLENGEARVAGTDRRIGMDRLARMAFHQTPRFGAGFEPGLDARAGYDPAGTFSNACQAAIVEVDAETGAVRFERFVIVEDAGRLINPLIVDGQIHGGVAQGIGNALFEEIVYDEAGNILTTTLADFLPPTALDVPAIEIHHLETLTDASVTKAKGLGEGAVLGAPAAVVNAVNDALAPLGVVFNEFPLTPRRIRAAVREAIERKAR